ncbi:hypothetical protein L596_026777 [Steinernema carpocapsae]|uniref:Uncharacterized protein n=1 Tax=Steinernema carpocapsae TaxID=34508 RepID=A0A4U5M3B4_STECR|nr:hypothetical protein L596_026777 [Steinernema carpocapsae]
MKSSVIARVLLLLVIIESANATFGLDASAFSRHLNKVFGKLSDQRDRIRKHLREMDSVPRYNPNLEYSDVVDLKTEVRRADKQRFRNRPQVWQLF